MIHQCSHCKINNIVLNLINKKLNYELILINILIFIRELNSIQLLMLSNLIYVNFNSKIGNI